MDYIEIKKEVKKALEKNKPVVALESTIISHGLPYPQNLKVAKGLAEIARDNGAVPATICLIDGKVKIGLSELELKIMASSEDVEKVSRRDIGKVISLQKKGATTVAATMYLAQKAGIEVFATGGIGGVHKNAENTFDISADLQEFAQTPVIVVSAGAKAILDLSKTLEIMETLGVPVYSYKTERFPAFYSHSSPFFVERINSVKDIVDIFGANKTMGLDCGMLIANPVPKKREIPYEEMKEYIQQALKSADEENISGKKLTPYLLSKLVDITDKKSLKANIDLVKNNVELASLIANELVKR